MTKVKLKLNYVFIRDFKTMQILMYLRLPALLSSNRPKDLIHAINSKLNI